MPAGKDSTATKSTGTGAVGSKRFELPALEFKFEPLTDGTDIPPPLPSPIPEEAVSTPSETPKDGLTATNGKTDAVKPQVDTVTTGVKRPAEDSPASPTLSSRPGSIRRLFSRTLLNKAYENGEEAKTTNARPPSRGAVSVVDSSRRAKRSSGWFSRLRGGDKNVSPLTEEKKPSGPPPPMIPELTEIKAKEDVSFSSDLFKDIK
ncbi:hypothetical protein QBC38DRAFT_364054 [Podospora fimiseda]|uniref:Uncharacterized protein n=1 Tax=Podospora fimiseda TaxID=252190 RepID=A0AAN7BQ96_9PEZI|nr:hypothetical protein QBC38DRAFT_364054 [Podospora fimiseda]